MNEQQQIEALTRVVDGYTGLQVRNLAREVIGFVIGRSRSGYVEFPVEEFAGVILDD